MLLEVIISMVILGVAVATIMRSFTLSMSGIRRNDISTQAVVLAESVLQSFEAMPPEKGKSNGDFSEQGFPEFEWVMEVDEEEIKYRDLQTASKIENLKSLRHVNLVVTFDDGRNRVRTPVQVDLILPPIERFSYDSKFRNELFQEEI